MGRPRRARDASRDRSLQRKASADTIKRVHQELGGKSANIVLSNADLEKAVTKSVASCLSNSGQSCNAPTRMFVPADRHDEAAEIAARAASTFKVGPADADGSMMLGLGVAGGLGQFFLYEGFRYAPASVVAPIEYTGLLWAFAFGYLIWADVPGVSVIAGAILIVGGSLGLVWFEWRHSKLP